MSFVRAALWTILCWMLLVFSCELMFMYYVFNDNSDRACYVCAFDRIRGEQQPNSWNHGFVWSKEYANHYRAVYTHKFIQEVWERSRIALLLAVGFLFLIFIMLIIRARFVDDKSALEVSGSP